MADIRTQLQKIVDRRNRRLGIVAGAKPPASTAAQASSTPSGGGSVVSGDNDPRYDAKTGELMEKRNILDDSGNVVAVLDYHSKSKSWFLDTEELAKIRNVRGIVSQILTHESQ